MVFLMGAPGTPSSLIVRSTRMLIGCRFIGGAGGAAGAGGGGGGAGTAAAGGAGAAGAAAGAAGGFGGRGGGVCASVWPATSRQAVNRTIRLLIRLLVFRFLFSVARFAFF